MAFVFSRSYTTFFSFLTDGDLDGYTILINEKTTYSPYNGVVAVVVVAHRGNVFLEFNVADFSFTAK